MSKPEDRHGPQQPRNLRLIQGKVSGTRRSEWQDFVERQRWMTPPLVKAAVMGSRRPDVARTDRSFYTLGEVCNLVGVEPHVVRYWESEFPTLASAKKRAGQRLYDPLDLHLLLRIRELLYEEQYTIPGARRKLNDELGKGGGKPPQSNDEG